MTGPGGADPADLPGLRIGHGMDVHRFGEGDAPLLLGGVRVEGEGARPLEGHSDADVVAHALADALLGAAGLGDLGAQFPTDDPTFAGADSIGLLEIVREMVGVEGWSVVNGDCTVVAQVPRLAPYVAAMAERLSAAVSAPVTVKATTTERLGSIGRSEGIACHAVVLLARAATSDVLG